MHTCISWSVTMATVHLCYMLDHSAELTTCQSSSLSLALFDPSSVELAVPLSGSFLSIGCSYGGLLPCTTILLVVSLTLSLVAVLRTFCGAPGNIYGVNSTFQANT